VTVWFDRRECAALSAALIGMWGLWYLAAGFVLSDLSLNDDFYERGLLIILIIFFEAKWRAIRLDY
jgi:hypothetical protein